MHRPRHKLCAPDHRPSHVLERLPLVRTGAVPPRERVRVRVFRQSFAELHVPVGAKEGQPDALADAHLGLLQLLARYPLPAQAPDEHVAQVGPHRWRHPLVDELPLVSLPDCAPQSCPASIASSHPPHEKRLSAGEEPQEVPQRRTSLFVVRKCRIAPNFNKGRGASRAMRRDCASEQWRI